MSETIQNAYSSAQSAYSSTSGSTILMYAGIFVGVGGVIGGGAYAWSKYKENAEEEQKKLAEERKKANNQIRANTLKIARMAEKGGSRTRRKLRSHK